MVEKDPPSEQRKPSGEHHAVRQLHQKLQSIAGQDTRELKEALDTLDRIREKSSPPPTDREGPPTPVPAPREDPRREPSDPRAESLPPEHIVVPDPFPSPKREDKK